jgi:hypothetical protein
MTEETLNIYWTNTEHEQEVDGTAKRGEAERKKRILFVFRSLFCNFADEKPPYEGYEPRIKNEHNA